MARNPHNIHALRREQAAREVKLARLAREKEEHAKVIAAAAEEARAKMRRR